MSRLRTALMFQDGNFVGREYFARLREAGRAPDLVIAAGAMKPDSIAREIERTGGRWNPPAIPGGVTVHRFAKLGEPELWKLVRERAIDAIVQGGVGILKPEMIAAPRIGIINVHPGRLPQYRGNSCPEWALLNGEPVVATAHLIDEGIDTGPVICAEPYDVAPEWDYPEFRARLYAHCGRVLAQALARLEAAGQAFASVLTVQDETDARYWPGMPPEDAARVRAMFPLQQAARAATHA